MGAKSYLIDVILPSFPEDKSPVTEWSRVESSGGFAWPLTSVGRRESHFRGKSSCKPEWVNPLSVGNKLWAEGKRKHSIDAAARKLCRTHAPLHKCHRDCYFLTSCCCSELPGKFYLRWSQMLGFIDMHVMCSNQLSSLHFAEWNPRLTACVCCLL